MNRRIIAFVVLAIGLAVLFVRLGFWQLDRLAQRRARNAEVARELARPPIPIEQLTDTGLRRVTVSGLPDYEHEIVITGRSHDGSPGVFIVTPVRITGTHPAVLVNRGWVYAPDAATVDLTKWRESRTTFSGYRQPLRSQTDRTTIKGRKVHDLTQQAARQLVPYPVIGLVISQDSVSAAGPVRLPMPALSNGPHLSYAIQWFSFAIIALVGAAIVAVRSARGATGA